MRHLSRLLAPLVAVAVAGAAAVLVLVAIQYSRNDRPIALPAPRGRHPVGRTLAAWTDARRSRPLMVFAWYPAATASTGRTARYIPGKWGALAAEGYLTIPAARMESIAVSALENAPPAAGAHPALVLLPALGRAPAHYTTLAEDLASHGYVVVGVAPTGSTRNVVFPDGHVEDGTVDPDQANVEVDADVVRQWTEDAEFAADHLLVQSGLASVVDGRRVGIVGHALGGAIAMRVIARDNRFRAAVNLDGGPLAHESGPPNRPLLILLAGPPPPLARMFTADQTDRLRAMCAAHKARCDLRRYDEAGYADFTDEAILPSRFPFPQRLFGRAVNDGEKFQREIADRLLEFFGKM